MVYIMYCVYVEIAKKLISRSEYNHEIETLKFKYLVAQETIEQLQKELKLKEEILNLKQRNSGGFLIAASNLNFNRLIGRIVSAHERHLTIINLKSS